jgi:O-antigen ligase
MIVAALALGLAMLPLKTLLLLGAGGVAVAILLIEPVFGLYAAVLSVPVQELVALPGGLSITQAAMLMASAAWALRVLAHPERRITTSRLFPLWATLLWALLLATSFTPYSQTEALKETLRWAEAFLIWLIAINTLQRRWQIIGLIACLLLAPAADAVIGLIQFLSGSGPPSFRITPDQIFVRAYGTIGQPNSFAGYLNMAWPLALALALGVTTALWRRRTRSAATEAHRAWSERLSLVIGLWIVAGLLLTALAASFSRGAWIGALCGLLVMALAQSRRSARWMIAAIGLGVLVLALGGIGLLPPVVAERLTSITRNLTFFDASTAQVTTENFAVVERMAQLQAGWRMFVAHPLTGVGPGNYTPAYPDFAVLPWYSSRGHAHNYYLHMAAEAGIIGALAYLALLIGACYQALTALRATAGTRWHSVAVGCCGIIATVAGHELFENLHALSMGIQIAAVWGLLAVLEKWQSRSADQE